MQARQPSYPTMKKQRIRTALANLAQTVGSWSWLPQVFIVVAVLVAASIFLWPSPIEFPMDDSYIHLVYAQNLSENGGLYFNDPKEKGVGTSSILWVLILAVTNHLGLSMHMVAKLVGLASLAAVGIGLYHLMRPFLMPWIALAGVLLVILSGHMIWFALSGMETMLFLALGILALLYYRRESWIALGVVLGLLMITRVEGIILALVIAGVDIWRRKSIGRGLLLAGTFCVLIGGPWILYLWLRSGFLLPTSGIGRRYSNIVSIQVATGQVKSLAWLSDFPALAFPLTWLAYSVEFILGGFALPAPYLEIDPGLGSFAYKLSIWAILGLATVVLPLLRISFKHLASLLKVQGWERDTSRLPWFIFLAWMILHNIGYMIYLPIIGAASRYAILNHVALWLALGLGIWNIRQSQYKYWFAAGITVIALANTAYWNRVYDSNLEHMLNVRIAAAEYIREQIPQNEAYAAFDVGALRYHSQRPLVDLGGLVDPDLIGWYRAGRFDQYLVEKDVRYLTVPGRSGTTADGFFDILKASGLGQSSLFELQQANVFEMDRERWLVGYQPTVNYQATVTIYKLIKSARNNLP